MCTKVHGKARRSADISLTDHTEDISPRREDLRKSWVRSTYTTFQLQWIQVRRLHRGVDQFSSAGARVPEVLLSKSPSESRTQSPEYCSDLTLNSHILVSRQTP